MTFYTAVLTTVSHPDKASLSLTKREHFINSTLLKDFISTVFFQLRKQVNLRQHKAPTWMWSLTEQTCCLKHFFEWFEWK